MVGALLVAATATWVGGDAQSQYDHARNLEASIAGRVDVCAGSTRRHARALVAEAEAFDRLDPAAQKKAAARVRVSRSRLRTGCEPEDAEPLPEVQSPQSGEVAFGGRMVVRAPAGTHGFVVYANGRRIGRFPGGRSIPLAIDVAPGRYTLRVRFLPRGEQVSRGVWIVPGHVGDFATPVERADPQLEKAGSSFRGWAGIWTHDLRTGRASSWNATAAFPAASTVKLGVLVAALRNYGARSAVSYDLRALTGWSSNLAANRLYRLLGFARVRDGLYALGMDASTYTGEYRVGTALGAPPRVSGRVTTARDLGRALFRLHAAALGRPFALAATKLTRREARAALGYLLSFDRAEANRGLLPLRYPTAEKNGWLNDAQHTAAVVYGPRGPKIVVLLTYRPGLRPVDARALGTRVYRLANP